MTATVRNPIECEHGSLRRQCPICEWDMRIAEMEVALQCARKKLELYRAQHSGEYVGGVEYTHLMRVIDEALKP